MNKINLCGLSGEEIFDIIQTERFDYNHAITVTNAIYKKRTSDFQQIPNIPKKLKAYLSVNANAGIYEPIASETSIDKTLKYLFRNTEGKQFETVCIPDGKRNTVCVSTQSGCRMGCPFCVTAKYGFHGSLTAGDIVNQIIGIPSASIVTHVVLMGMGEPMDNLENVLKATNIMTAEWGMAFSPRNITVSTVGLMPAVRSFLERSSCNLTLSLYSPFADERINVIPAEKKYAAMEIIEVMKSFSVKKKRRLSIAYVMIRNVNDTDRHLAGLKKMLAGSEIRVNLLPYHPVKNDVNLPSSDEKMLYFKHNLVISGVSASVRKSRGEDISAACGLLASGLKYNVI
jgi:23S rRNA (adenine2503-C2)-methyltransferase